MGRPSTVSPVVLVLHEIETKKTLKLFQPQLEYKGRRCSRVTGIGFSRPNHSHELLQTISLNSHDGYDGDSIEDRRVQAVEGDLWCRHPGGSYDFAFVFEVPVFGVDEEED